MQNTNNSKILRVTDLTVTFQGQAVLDHVSFSVEKGTATAVMGPNGAGKTILFKALLNLIPHEGKVEWAPKATIGYVPQSISVLDIPISVREFLSFKGKNNVSDALDLVRLRDKGVLDKRLDSLSGGQLRRVFIAWALIDEPDVLLFDEPTTGVDMNSEEPIYRRLSELKKEKQITTLLITHDFHIVNEYSDYVMALNKCITYYGESKQITHMEVQRRIFGEPVCTGAPL